VPVHLLPKEAVPGKHARRLNGLGDEG
jgi:hypothetical protein